MYLKHDTFHLQQGNRVKNHSLRKSRKSIKLHFHSLFPFHSTAFMCKKKFSDDRCSFCLITFYDLCVSFFCSSLSFISINSSPMIFHTSRLYHVIFRALVVDSFSQTLVRFFFFLCANFHKSVGEFTPVKFQ